MKTVTARIRTAVTATVVTTTLAVVLTPGVAGAATTAKTAADDAPPTIVNQPVAQSATLFLPARFAVKATGENLTYQWQRRIGSTWYAIDKAPIPSMHLKRVVVEDDGAAFRVKVSNGAGTVTSKPALLDVTPATSTTTISINKESQAYDAPREERAIVRVTVRTNNRTKPRGFVALYDGTTSVGVSQELRTDGPTNLRVFKLSRGVHQLSVRFIPRSYQEVEWIDGSTSDPITFEVL